jgi:arylsulfatase A
MTRRTLLTSALFLGAQTPKPNIILVLFDDLGYKDFSCYGSQYYSTPNIDAIAAAGTRYTNYYAACPVCSPTRASVLTGKYPTRTGITDWIPGYPAPKDSLLATPQTRNELAHEHKTIAEYLKPLGYATASMGKWHLGGEGFSPLEQGFDLNVGGTAKGQPNRYLAPFDMPDLSDAPAGTELSAHLTTKATAWIKQQTKPFFLYLPHFAVHTPLGSLPALIEKYKAKPHVNPTYSAMMECADNAIGELRRAAPPNTIFILTSDNGGISAIRDMKITSNLPLRQQKAFLYEGGIRVPLILSVPGQKPQVSDTRACSIDLLPTILDLVKQPAPQGIDGTSILKRKSTPTYYWHYPHYHSLGSKPGGAILEGDYKLIEYFEDGSLELYNLKADLSETRNLAQDKPQIAKRLQAKLAAWRQATGAVMPVRRTVKKTVASLPSPANKSG